MAKHEVEIEIETFEDSNTDYYGLWIMVGTLTIATLKRLPQSPISWVLSVVHGTKYFKSETEALAYVIEELTGKFPEEDSE